MAAPLPQDKRPWFPTQGDPKMRVQRAACLACRTAKRRCDGVMPVCGPCQNRNVELGGCNFVSSKRGGPRYKGVKGADAAKVKADKDRAKEAAKMRGKRSDTDGAPSFRQRSDRSSTSSQLSNSPPGHGYDQQAPYGGNVWYHNTTSSLQSPTESSQTQSAQTSYGPSPANLPYLNQQQHYPARHFGMMPEAQPRYAPVAPQEQPQSFSTQIPHSGAFSIDNAHAPQIGQSFQADVGGPLSFANLELWQRIQEGGADQEFDIFSDFYSKLEMLPKAGNPGACDTVALADPLDVLMDWEGGEVGNNVQDNEQGARNLLADYYENVYPSCPVLLPPGNLPSLAFYFSGKGPCGLFASISCLVSLHLPPHEAVKTLKNSQAAMDRLQSLDADIAPESVMPTDRMMTVEEVAEYHAKTAELILHQYSEAKAACFIDTTCPNPFAGLDEELITIEAAAAHTLLCHYYYGSGKPLSHQRAYKHAVEAWDLVQKLDLRAKTLWQESHAAESHHIDASRPFSSDLKLEWGKRVCWASYAAATVMSCTGGFQPFGNPKDEVLDLKLRPHLEYDVAAWGTMVRGAQQVSRTYRLLYELEQLRVKLSVMPAYPSQNDLHQASMERQTIFNAMLKLDSEIGTYTRFDPGWRNIAGETQATDGASDYTEVVERRLAQSLKIAGRLMTSGALIILHRAQAFSNAKVFMQPQCGIPEAARQHKPPKHDAILHNAISSNSGDSSAKSRGGMLAGLPAKASTNGGESSNDSAYHQGAMNTTTTTTTTTSSSSTPSTSHTLISTHPLLTDRFAGGPFEPAHSLERCRFAANSMISTLPNLVREGRTPRLPPYSACSYVLGAYATLMLTLLIQIHAEEGTVNSGGDTENAGSGTSIIRLSKGSVSSSQDTLRQTEELRLHLATHRAPVKDIIVVLKHFAKLWNKAVEYHEEVSTLLAANEALQ